MLLKGSISFSNGKLKCVVKVTYKRKVLGYASRKIFGSLLYTLAQNASPNIMYAISSKDLKLCCMFSTRGILQDGLEDFLIFHIYYLQSQFEPQLIYSKAISSVLR